MSKEPASTSCVFCRILEGELAPGVVAFRDSHAAVFPSLHQQPRNRGHMLVVPTRHVRNIYELDGNLAGPLMATLSRVAGAVKHSFNADGVSIRQNNDPHGGQDVFHLHFHVIPRFACDGFTVLHPSLGAIELSIDERLEQAKRLRLWLEQATVSPSRSHT
jgi:histidine triad (HIT) family protein